MDRLRGWLAVACALTAGPAWSVCDNVSSAVYRYSYGATVCSTLEEIEALMPDNARSVYPGVNVNYLANNAAAVVDTAYRPNGASDPNSGALVSPPASTTASFRVFAKGQPGTLHPSCTAIAPSCTSAGCGNAEDLRKLVQCQFDASWGVTGGTYCWQRTAEASIVGAGFTRPPSVTGSGSQTANVFYGPSSATSFDSGMTISIAAQTCPTVTFSEEAKAAPAPVPRTFNWGVANDSSVTCSEGSSVGGGGGCAAQYIKYSVEAPAMTQTPQQCGAGNPCFPGNGNKQVYEDGLRYGEIALDFTYNSLRQAAPLANIDRNWSHSFAKRIHTQWMVYSHYASEPGPEGGNGPTPVGNIPGMIVQDERTQLESFLPTTPVGTFRSTATIGKYLRYVTGATAAQQSWELDYPDGRRETYDRTGRLVSMIDPEDPRGTLTFSYGSTPSTGTLYQDPAVADPMFWRLVRVTDGSGRYVTFEYENPPMWRVKRVRADDGTELLNLSYDAASRLVNMTRFGKVRSFLYNEPANIGVSGVTGYWLTGVLDEDGRRYATYTYDGYGRVTGSWHGTDAGKVTVQYPGDYQSIVTDPSGGQTTYNYAQNQPYRRVSGVSSTDGSISLEFNAAHRIGARVDKRGMRTEYEYSADGSLETARNEAMNTPQQRRIETDWDPLTRLRTAERIKATPPGGPVSLLKDKRYRYVSGTRRLAGIDEYDPASGAQRSINYTYCSAADVAAGATTNCAIEGQLKSVDGPRTDVSDVTAHAYRITDAQSGCGTAAGPCWRKGDLWKTANALGHVDEVVSYDLAGRVRRIKDANGVITDYTYNARGWLNERAVRANASGAADPAFDAVTTYVYDDSGNLTRFYPPGGQGAYVDYTYDAAHRVTAVGDAYGNHVSFVLDKAGNRLDEKTYDSGNVLRRSLAREFNALNRLVSINNAGALPVLAFTETAGDMQQGYDANGNPRRFSDGRGIVTDRQYDPLDRLVQVLQDYRPAGDRVTVTGNTTLLFGYDAADRLVRVTDGDQIVTDYGYDGFGFLRSVASPDGGTRTHVYDPAGNRIQETDARGVVAERVYDALGRLVDEHFPLSMAGLGSVLQYDEPDSVTQCNGSFPLGRLTRAMDVEGITTYCYDRRGNIVKKTVDTLWGAVSIGYEYTRGDQLKAITYPDGSIVRYTRDQMRRIIQVSYQYGTLTVPQVLVSNVSYYPFGPVQTLTFGNGRTLTKSYDADYHIDSVTSSQANGLALDLQTDVVGNVTAAAAAPGAVPLRRYSYDNLGRLTNTRTDAGTPLETYAYTRGGDRTSKNIGSTVESYLYTAGSHRLSKVASVERSYDANGATTTGIASTALQYDDYGRLSRMPTSPGVISPTDYVYNAHYQRVRKFNASLRTDAWYGETGLRLADIDYSRSCSDMRKSGAAVDDWPVEICPGGGLLVTELLRRMNYIYLDGVPIAVAETPAAGATSVYYVETDHLGTPRQLIEPTTNAVKWQWDFFGTAFGEHPAVVPPGGVRLDMRYPGQFYDVESGLHYNGFRTYEPRTGRYVESDPIGLLGGYNTYAYVTSNPLSLVDPFGLQTVLILRTEDVNPQAWVKASEFEASKAKEKCPQCNVVTKDVNRVEQLNDEIRSNSDIISVIIIGHSGPAAIYFGTSASPDTNLAVSVDREADTPYDSVAWDKLRPDATIKLLGCRNALENNSIAEAIARASQREVIGTTRPLNFDEQTGEPYFNWYWRMNGAEFRNFPAVPKP